MIPKLFPAPFSFRIAGVFLLVSFSTAPIAADLIARYEAGSVVVDGVSEGGPVAYLRVEEQARAWTMVRRVDRDVIVDSDSDGRVTIDVEGQPTRGLLVALDTKTGAIAWTTPAAVEVDVRELSVDQLRPGNQGGFSDLEWGWGEIEALWFRRGAGVWWLQSVDGGENDADGLPNNQQRVSFSRAERLEGSQTPTTAQVSDRLVVIDLDQMTLRVWIEDHPSAGAGAGGAR